MAGRISGITIEIGGDTTKLQASLSQVDKQLKNTQSSLKDINKLLKLDPKNTELLAQKQKQLKSAVDLTSQRLEELKKAQDGVAKGTDDWDRLQREIIATEQDLKKCEKEYKEFGSIAKQKIQAVGQQMQELGNKITAVGEKFAPISKAAAGLMAGFGALGVKAVQTADDINTLSKQTGLSTDEIQKMQYAAERVDVPFENISGALTKVKKKMTESNKTFKTLGVSVKNADGSLRDATDVFYDSIQALSQIENETERDQLAMELFGMSADQLAGIIDDGGAALKEYGKEAEELGLILSGDDLNSLNAINDQLDKMKAVLLGAALKVGLQIAQAAAPLVDKVAAGLEKLAGWLSQLTPEQMKIVMTVTAVIAAIGPVIIMIGKITSGIGSIINLIGMLNPVTLGIIAVIAAVVAAGIWLYKNWDKVRAFAEKATKAVAQAWEDLKNKLIATYTRIKDTTVKKWEEIKTKITTTIDNIKKDVSDKWENIRSTITSKIEEIVSNVTTSWDNIKTTIETTVQTIFDTISQIWDNIKTTIETTVDNIWSSVTEKFDNIKTTILDTWEDVKNGVTEKIGNLWDSVTEKFDGIKRTISDAVENIKGVFNFEWSLPTLKMPHFNVTWEEKLGGRISLPKFDVEWYKKAYNNPVMFNSPTVLNTASGMKGFGDGHGAEIVMGLDKLRELVGNQKSDVTINIVQQPWQDAKQLANEVQKVLVRQNSQRSAVYA